MKVLFSVGYLGTTKHLQAASYVDYVDYVEYGRDSDRILIRSTHDSSDELFAGIGCVISRLLDMYLS